ncbi:MAG: SH3 domain-containing protein [Polyangia bacterium]|nr:SH3 domain-containing protein [Polyangia bacterium]
MTRTITAGLFAGGLLALSLGLVHSAPAPGKELSVRALSVNLMAKPQFLGASVASLRRGEKVKMIRAEGAWYLVSYEGKEGWLHSNRLSEKIIQLRAGDTGSGTSRGEAELAGRGFSPKTEATFKEKNPNLDFSHVDKIQGVDVEPDSVEQFYSTGGLQQKGGGR